MSGVRVAWFGDVVGRPGRGAIAHAAPLVRTESGVDLVIANAENVRHGRGLHPPGYEELRTAGVDVCTLGDHVLDDERMLPMLQDPEQPIAKPINLTQWPHAEVSVGVEIEGTPIRVITVLGRLFMKFEVESPFEALDRSIASMLGDEPGAVFLVEVHAEATSEKIAVLWHCRERWSENVLAVVGSHTHVQTSDARIVDDRVAAMTDLGMCGGRRSVIGFNIQASLERFNDTRGTQLDVAGEDPVAEGCFIGLDLERRRATSIEPFRIQIP